MSQTSHKKTQLHMCEGGLESRAFLDGGLSAISTLNFASSNSFDDLICNDVQNTRYSEGPRTPGSINTLQNVADHQPSFYRLTKCLGQKTKLFFRTLETCLPKNTSSLPPMKGVLRMKTRNSSQSALLPSGPQRR